MNIFKIILYTLLIFGFFLYFRHQSKKQSNMGINLRRVVCPKCNTKQPIIRIPKNSEQAMFGGTTCPNCNTELDKYGNVK